MLLVNFVNWCALFRSGSPVLVVVIILWSFSIDSTQVSAMTRSRGPVGPPLWGDTANIS